MTHIPWLPYLATGYIKYLYSRSAHNWSVFEWGSGESTFFFTNLGVKYLVSIEHDIEWWEKVSQQVKIVLPFQVIETKIIYPENGEIGTDKANPDHYKSGSTELGKVNFKNYASTIDNYGLFDLILIDGMARASCLKHAFSHVRPGGCIVLDNTGDRSYYLEQTAHLFGNWESGWERVTFHGWGPILAYKWETTFFINRGKDDYPAGA